MLKKIFFIGLGFSIIAAKKSVSYIRASRAQSHETNDIDTGKTERAGTASETPAAEDFASQETNGSQAALTAVDTTPQSSEPTGKQDDLTEINGIGPTYSKRLVAAGILTFAELAKQTPDSLRSITQAKGQSADPESWIAEALVLSG